jgi:hypothetical protein
MVNLKSREGLGKGMFVGFTLMAFGRMEWDFELLN